MDTRKSNYKLEVWGGIECTINRVSDRFFDQLQYNDLYANLDVNQLAQTGIKKMRFPVLWEKHQPQRDTVIDWRWTEEKISELLKNGITIIAGLVHHGSGPLFTNLLDADFPYLLAAYAKEVAQKFPSIDYYTPVNEPLTTARFSGLYGYWYPHKTDEGSFLQMLLNELKGVVLSMQEIRKINPHAKLVQTEDLGKTYSTPLLQYQADFENTRRWLTYDILCGLVNKEHPMWGYFIGNGIKAEDLNFFLENACVPDIFGFNHYVTSERFLDENVHLYPPHTHGGNFIHSYADVEAVRVDLNEPIGIEVLVKEAWNRYKKPIAVTEVHLHCHREEQLRWFHYVWKAAQNLNNGGVDIIGVTAWAMLGSYGWNKLLTQPGGDYEPGVFDLSSGFARPTALSSFILKISTEEKNDHPVLQENGWWQRGDRFIHKSSVRNKNSTICFHKPQRPLLIIGKRGTLGNAFARICTHRCIPFHLLSRQDCDIACAISVLSAIEKYNPWGIINAAGFVRVDDAEAEFDACFRENTTGPQNLAIACAQRGVKLITFSSDLVFDGKKKMAYVEDDDVNPLNVYGKSKAAAERLVLEANPDALMVRTSAFFSPWDKYNFLYWVIDSLSQMQEVPIANDVIVSPTFVPDLVNVCLDLLIDDEKGIWHLTNNGSLSWADLAYEVAHAEGLQNKWIKSMPVKALNLAAPRPHNSALKSIKCNHMPSLDSALHRFLAERKSFVKS